MAEQKDKCVPRLRFPEFKNDGEWAFAILSDLIGTVSPPKKLQSNEYHSEGNYPIVDQSKEYICGYSNDSDAVFNKDSEDLIVFGDHTCILKLVRFPFIQGADGIRVFKSRDTERLSTHFLYHYLCSKPIIENQYKRHFSELKETGVKYPVSVSEQSCIAECFSSLDSYISSSKAKLEQLKAHKKGLMQKLFPTPGKTLPEYRFPEFKNGREWVTAKLSDFIKMVSPPKKIQSSEYYSSGRYPIIDQSKDYICGFSNDENAVFNNDSEDVIVFGDHTCVLKLVDFPFIQGADGIKVFKSNNPTIVSTLFLYHFLSLFPVASVQYKRHFIELKEKEINFPVDIFEQSCITTCLSSLDSLITASQESLTQLIAHKQGLLKQLFL